MQALEKVFPWAPLVARILVGGLFIMAGWSKVTGFAGTVGFAQSVGLPSPELAIIIAIILEIGGGLSILLGYHIKWGALALAIFTVAVSFIFHRDFGDPMQQLLFTKNMGIAAALLYMTRFGAGKLAIER
jgi:putative oxidoreductase